MTSTQFFVGLVALKAPIGENGPVAAATALVQFDESLPIHAMATIRRVFEAAERVFRSARHLPEAGIGVRESFLPQAVEDGRSLHEDRIPDGVWAGARVWLSGG